MTRRGENTNSVTRHEGKLCRVLDPCKGTLGKNSLSEHMSSLYAARKHCAVLRHP